MATYQSKFTGQEIDAKLDEVGRVATAETLGVVKVGEGLEITEDGVLNAIGGGIGGSFKKAILSKDGLQLEPSQNFDMDIKYNGGFKVNNGRIVLEKGKKYYISIQAGYFVASTNDSQFAYHANAGDEITMLYATTWSYSKAGADGTGCDVFEPTEDTELTFQTESWSSSVTSVEVRCVVEELGGGSSSVGGSDTPIGTIIPYMGTTAPEDYLVCDGAVLNITDYPKLANHFEAQFGTKNHFGGDGTTTFAVPDLRNEFLRGYGDLSNEIGEHQDATTHLNFYVGQSNILILDTKNDVGITNVDSDTGVDLSTNSRAKYNPTTNNATEDDQWGGMPTLYTSRPTNVAVLYCIKYTEGTSGGNSSSENTSSEENYSTEEQRIGTWIDGKPLYRKVYKFDITSTTTRTTIVIDKDFGLEKQMKKIYGNVYGENSQWNWWATYHLGLYHYWKDTGDVFSFLPNVEKNDLVITTQWSATCNFTVEAVVEYTKTTD